MYVSSFCLQRWLWLIGDLLPQMDAEGWVLIAVIASFNRVKALSQDLTLIQGAVARSTELETRDGHVRRRGDWFRWVLPTAAPSVVQPLHNGIVPLRASDPIQTTKNMEGLTLGQTEEIKLDSAAIPALPTG